MNKQIGNKLKTVTGQYEREKGKNVVLFFMRNFQVKK
jgi:hypothetical protein